MTYVEMKGNSKFYSNLSTSFLSSGQNTYLINATGYFVQNQTLDIAYVSYFELLKIYLSKFTSE